MRDRLVMHARYALAPRIERLESRIAPSVFVVTNLRDAGGGSLRAAINQANTNAGDDSIVFAGGLKGQIKLKTALEITDDVTIDGPAKKIGITGKSKTQLFVIEGTDLDVGLTSLKLKGGLAESGGAIFIDDPGGTVTITRCLLAKNAAVGEGGVAGAAEGGDAQGGAISIEEGTLQVRQSKITGNRAVGGDGVAIQFAGGDAKGGAIYAGAGTSVTITDSRLVKNLVASGEDLGVSSAGGGAVMSGGTLDLRNSVISKNTVTGQAEAAGGGIDNFGDGTLTVMQSTITGNTAIGRDGFAGAKGINGTTGADGARGYDGDPGYDGEDGYEGDVGEDAGDGDNGSAGGAALGGGIFNSGTLTLQTSTISGNQVIAGNGGSGGRGGDGGRGGEGGNGGNGGRATVIDGYAYPMGYGGSGGDGGDGGQGGIGGDGGDGGNAQGGGVFNTATATFTQSSTISGNTTKAGIAGAGGEHGTGGAPGNGGKKGQGRAGDGGEYDYTPMNGLRGDPGLNGGNGSNGTPGIGTGTDVFPIVVGVSPASAASAGNFVHVDANGIGTIQTSPAIELGPPLFESIRDFVAMDLLSPTWLLPSAEVQLAALRLEASSLGAVRLWSVPGDVFEESDVGFSP